MVLLAAPVAYDVSIPDRLTLHHWRRDRQAKNGRKEECFGDVPQCVSHM
jgi:hypothetical protein